MYFRGDIVEIKKLLIYMPFEKNRDYMFVGKASLEMKEKNLYTKAPLVL